jgi:hypothetical protein
MIVGINGRGTMWWFVQHHVCNYETGFVYSTRGYEAQASMRDCGATTSLNTQVAVSTPSVFDLPGTYESTVVFQSTHTPIDLSLRWQSPTHLIIEYPAGEEGRVRKALPAWKEVTITHQARKE